MEYPKQLYRKGWDDLTDTIVVDNDEQEGEARASGFFMLTEQSESEPADPPIPRRRRAAEPQDA